MKRARETPKTPSSPSGVSMNSAQVETAAPSTARPDALMPGARLEEFEIERLIGASGFGLVYLANDQAFERHVAIKEYLPDTLAVRGDDGASVLLRAASHAEAFERGRRAFVEEAQLLERCNHPSLLHVLRSWEANGTVYRAMPHYPGHSILSLRQAMDEPPDEASLRALLEGLLGALDELHRTGAIHREIAPANILLLPDDRPVLMDFGAARRAIVGDQARALMTLLAPSFAPVEQTAPAPDRPQGPWTDLYALAAVIRYCISGELPPPASVRSPPANEPMGRVAQRVQQTFPHRHYSPSFLTAIDAALAIRPQDRPQSVSAFLARLDDHPAAVYVEPEWEGARRDWGPGPTDSEPMPAPAAIAAAPTMPHPPAPPSPPTPPPPVPQPPPSPPVPPPPMPTMRFEDPPPTSTPVFASTAPEPWLARPATDGFSAADSPPPRATPDLRRGRAHRTRRRVAWAGGLLLLFVVGAAAWLLDQERQTMRAQSEFAQAAREDGLTANVPAVPQSPSEEEPAPADGNAPDMATEIETEIETERASDALPDAPTAAVMLPPRASVESTAPAPAPAARQAVELPPTAAVAPPPAAVAPATTAAAPPTAAIAPPTAETAPEARPAEAPAAPEPAPAAVQPPVRDAQVATIVTDDAESSRPPPPRVVKERSVDKGKPMAPVLTATPRAVPQARKTEPEPASPRAVCGDRTQFSLYRCMQTQCVQARWKQHAHCKLLRARDEVAF